MRISDWSSDVCSSDLIQQNGVYRRGRFPMAYIGCERFSRKICPRQVGGQTFQSLARLIHSGHAPTGGGKLHRFAPRRGTQVKHVFALRSAERRVGKEYISSSRYRWSPFPLKKNNT